MICSVLCGPYRLPALAAQLRASGLPCCWYITKCTQNTYVTDMTHGRQKLALHVQYDCSLVQPHTLQVLLLHSQLVVVFNVKRLYHSITPLRVTSRRMGDDIGQCALWTSLTEIIQPLKREVQQMTFVLLSLFCAISHTLLTSPSRYSPKSTNPMDKLTM